MLTYVIKHNFTMLLPLLGMLTALFLIGSVFICRRFILANEDARDFPPPEIHYKEPVFTQETKLVVTSHDIKAIAGEDVYCTQLDLARAYIETGRKQLAKKIINHVIARGHDGQRQEAQRLLNMIMTKEINKMKEMA